MRWLLVSALVGLACLASPVVAQTPNWTVAAHPAQARKGSQITVSSSGTATSTGHGLPQGITLALFKGFGLDLDADAERCRSTASPPSCPAGSRVASGRFAGTGSYIGFSRGFSGTVQAFLAPPTSGDLADVIAVMSVTGYGSGSARGKLVAVDDPTFGYELRLDPLPSAMLPPGATATIDQFSLTTGATRKTFPSRARSPRRVSHKRCGAKRRRCKRKRLRHRLRGGARVTRTRSLITNPSTCAGSWPMQVRVRYADRLDVHDALIACTP